MYLNPLRHVIHGACAPMIFETKRGFVLCKMVASFGLEVTPKPFLPASSACPFVSSTTTVTKPTLLACDETRSFLRHTKRWERAGDQGMRSHRDRFCRWCGEPAYAHNLCPSCLSMELRICHNRFLLACSQIMRFNLFENSLNLMYRRLSFVARALRTAPIICLMTLFAVPNEPDAYKLVKPTVYRHGGRTQGSDDSLPALH